MELHQRLVAARKHAGFQTAAEAAEALGIPYQTYAGHENGNSGFRADKGDQYARRFKVRFEWLMREIGPMLDPAQANPEDQLRAALLAFGVDRNDLGRAIAVIKGFVDDLAERSEPGPGRDRSEPASPRRVKEPSR